MNELQPIVYQKIVNLTTAFPKQPPTLSTHAATLSEYNCENHEIIMLY